MITAHLPSGYVLGRTLGSKKSVFWAAVAGAIFPDFDLIWFYLVDNRSVHHHAYWVHIPGFWAMLAAVILPLLYWRGRRFFGVALAFACGITLHLLLDTVAGDIKWLWPFDTRFFHLIEVTSRYDAWVFNFILHPVMLLELAIWGVAL